jgi:hypothetical protein
MARSYVARELVKLGGQPRLREGFTTDNGNLILDVHGLSIVDPVSLETAINHIVGVVTNGLFARRGADVLLLGTASGVKTYCLKGVIREGREVPRRDSLNATPHGFLRFFTSFAGAITAFVFGFLLLGGHPIFLGGPLPEIDQLAALAAKRLPAIFRPSTTATPQVGQDHDGRFGRRFHKVQNVSSKVDRLDR